MNYNVVDKNMKKVGSVDLPDDIFGAPVKEKVLWEQVKAQLASRRRGTHKTKKRGEVRGGGIKPFKQKGTGLARQGSIRAPQFVGGGRVFGPVPRDYSYRLPKSARKTALKMVLSLRMKEQAIVVLDSFAVETPKTKEVLAFLEKLGTNSALLVDAKNVGLAKSTRNLRDTKFLAAEAINVYDVLDYDKLVLTKAALEAVVKRATVAGKSPKEVAS
jgi:large subunit ribosomal protein L4